MTFDETKFCQECGCEILSDEDIGYNEIYYEYHSVTAGSEQKKEIQKTFIICRSCKEETESQYEEFLQTPEARYECQFQKWVEELIKQEE